jgi:hypothetical protein
MPIVRKLDVAARDRRTLELRQLFALPHKIDEETSYETKVWLYFPRGFGISPASWTVDAFYKDAHTFMRLHAPALRLKDFADLEHPTNPAAILRRQLPMLVEDVAPTAQALDTLAKTLGAELVDAVTTTTRGLIARIREVDVADSKATLVRDVDACCTDVLRALGAVRRVRAKARAYRTVAPSLLPALAFAEEFSSAMVDERLAELAHVIEEVPALRDGSGAAVKMRLNVARAAEAVHRRRREQGFPIPSGAAGASPEYFTYRLGVLKTEMQRALYVTTRANKSDPFWRNSAAAVAAGLAATWALLAQVQLFSGGLSTQQSVLLFMAAVFAYILKDRMKEWTRALLTRKLLKWDHNERIVGDALSCAGLGKIGGRAAEVARWVKDTDVPKTVAALRQSVRTVRGVAELELEHILLVHRRVVFEADQSPVPEGFGVQELFRLSLDEIVKRLDDPVDEVAYYDPESGCFARVDMPKVYHMNLIAQATDETTGDQVTTRFRIVVNQQGILHIDRVLERTGNRSEALTLIEQAAE